MVFKKQKFYKFIDFLAVFLMGILALPVFSFKNLLICFLSGLIWVFLMDAIGVHDFGNINNFKKTFNHFLFSLPFIAFFYLLIYFCFKVTERFLIIQFLLSFLLILILKLIFIKGKILNKFKKKIIIVSEEIEKIKSFIEKIPEYEIVSVIKYSPTKPNGGILKERILPYEIVTDYGAKILENYKIKYFEEIYEKITGRIPIDFIKNEEYLKEFLKRSKKGKFFEISKRIFDIVGALIGGIIYLLIFPFIAILVKIDSEGPLFYKHKRTGKDGKVFTIYKIRTMIKDAEKEKPVWAKKDDPRITRVGKFLRKTRLDEFTQLFNILKGEMSAIGPRPERPGLEEEIKKHIPCYELRYLVKPGMAGWAMVNYDYVDSVEDAKIRHEYDLYYIKNRSFYLDFKIFIRALYSLLLLKGR
ncbi:MAG: sugar transferase [candidate division WOR-3 bacterium]